LIEKVYLKKEELVTLTQRGLNILELNLSISLSLSISQFLSLPVSFSVSLSLSLFTLIKKGIAYKEELANLI